MNPEADTSRVKRQLQPFIITKYPQKTSITSARKAQVPGIYSSWIKIQEQFNSA